MFKVDYNLQAGFKMSKWADFLISAIRYENEVLKNSIAYLKVHHDQGAEIGAGYTWTKEEVILLSPFLWRPQVKSSQLRTFGRGSLVRAALVRLPFDDASDGVVG